MIAAACVLAAWLHPALWLMLPVALLTAGPGGVWIGLLAVVAPLLAQARAVEPLPAAAARLATGVLVAVGGLLLWANLALAGDVAVWLGRPRWHGVALAGGGALLIAVWPVATRVAPGLVLLALVSLGLSGIGLARASGTGPLEAWDRVASRPAFHFAPSSPWVTAGRALARVGAPEPAIRFDEEHRITAASPGSVRIRSQDGPVAWEREWELAPGQSVTLFPGDWLEAGSGLRLRFEAGRRVPGAPTSGSAWARAGTREAGRLDLVECVGVGLTLVGGAVALLRPLRRPSPAATALAALGLLATLLWAEVWAVYGALTAPEVFLGGIGPGRMLELPLLALGEPAGEPYLSLLVMGGLGGFLASSAGLRSMAGRLAGGGREIDRAVGLWATVLAAASAASLWFSDPWALTQLALGLAASAVAPMLLARPDPGPGRAPLWAGLLGLTLFAGLSLAARAGDLPPGVNAALAHPALVALPAAVVVGRLAR